MQDMTTSVGLGVGVVGGRVGAVHTPLQQLPLAIPTDWQEVPFALLSEAMHVPRRQTPARMQESALVQRVSSEASVQSLTTRGVVVAGVVVLGTQLPMKHAPASPASDWHIVPLL